MSRLFFKGNIKDFKGYSCATNIIYEILVVGQSSIIGREIVTGHIFPLYMEVSDEYVRYSGLVSRIYRDTKNFLPLPYDYEVSECGDIIKFKLCKESEKNIASETEIENYLQKYANDRTFRENISSLARSNNSINTYDSLKKSIEKGIRKYTLVDRTTTATSFYMTRMDNSYNSLKDIAKFKDNEMEHNKEVLDKYMENEATRDLIRKLNKLNLGYVLNDSNNLTHALGREDVIKRLIKDLCILKQSVILLGEAGCGKTSIVEELTNQIKENKKIFIQNKIIYKLITANLVSGTKYRGSFEERILELIDICRASCGQIILFIDEVHTLYGAGNSEGEKNVLINLLKPYIEKGDILLLGATTFNEYNETLAQDKAFTSRLDIIKVDNLNKDINNQIIYNYISYLQEFYDIEFNFNESQLNIIIELLLDLASHQNCYEKIMPLRIIKRILANSVANAIYDDKREVSATDILQSIFETDEIIIQDQDKYTTEFNYKLNIKSERPKVLMFTK